MVAATRPTSIELGRAWNNWARMLWPREVEPSSSGPTPPIACFGRNAPERKASGPSTRPPTSARTSSARKMVAPMTNLRLPSRTWETPRTSMVGRAISSSIGTAAAKLVLPPGCAVADTWVDQRIRQINCQVGRGNRHDDQQDAALDHREVERLDGV